jgi:NADH-quinone oxidoreductase subunit G
MAKKPTEYIEIEIDDQPVKLPRDQVVLWSARALGFDIPHFCAHRWLEPFGGCRMCMVKVELGGRMMPKLQTSCSLMPAEGMKIWTTHPEVIQARKEQLEFHLLNHPLECPICDKGGECMLQDQTMDHGVQQGRFIEQKRIRPDAIMNNYIRLNYKRCIHCKRCVNYASDITGSYFLQFVERGAETYIDSFADPAAAPRFSGNVIDICPVGALTAINYRFVMGRPWEQELKPSVGCLDSVGANIWLNARLGNVARIVPRDNPTVENGMIDDATRFSWECVEDRRRITKAIIREGGGETQVSRNAGEHEAAVHLERILGEHGPDSVGLLAGGGLNTEEYYALKLFAARLGAPCYHLGDFPLGDEAVPTEALALFSANHTDIEGIMAAGTVLTLGCDLFEEAPSLGLRLDIAARRRQLKLLGVRSHGSEFDRFATRFLDYGYGNLLRVIRGLTNALNGAGEAPDDVRELAEELRNVGEDCAILLGDEAWRGGNPLALLRAAEGLRAAIARANPEAVGAYLNPVYPSVNSVGALWVNNLEQYAAEPLEAAATPAISTEVVLEAAAGGRLKALLIFDFDLLTRYPDRYLVESALRETETVIYCGPFANPTSEASQLHLPLGTWAHREGLVFNLEWRLQKRCRGSIDTIAPSVLDVLNSICAGLDWDPVAFDDNELRGELATVCPLFAVDGADKLADSGVLFEPELPAAGPAEASSQLPDEVTGSDGQFVIVPKRFLYNDREEIRYSRVFDKVAKPFFAHFNPADLAQLGVAEGAPVTLVGSDGSELQLPAKAMGWVRTGSIVINDHYLKQPANLLAGPTPAFVSVKAPVGAREE